MLSIKGGHVLILGTDAKIDRVSLEEVGGEITKQIVEEITLLRQLVVQVYELNDKGGPGSRKAVRELLAPIVSRVA